MRKTKIVATLGPASNDEKTILAMIAAGVNIFRLNFSHGTHEEYYEKIDIIKRSGAPVAVMLDTMGPEIRTGLIEDGVFLEVGEKITVAGEEILGNKERICVSYKNLHEEVQEGSMILIDDGLIELRVISIENNDIVCEIIAGGPLSSRKGVNIPGTRINLPSMTPKDHKDIEFGVANDITFVAASFIRKAEDIIAMRKVLEELGSEAKIIAKIENQEGVENIDEILAVADGVMVARGDMGVELPPEKVPIIQKQIIQKCNEVGKPVITATQMLESMIYNLRPTRAEASDVANAILDGTDATMLSGETAVGKYPVDAVKTMAKIANETEDSLPYQQKIFEHSAGKISRTVTDSISFATCKTAGDLGAAAIITSTRSGYTARMVSKYLPRVPIIAATPNRNVFSQLLLSKGVYPILVSSTNDTDTMIDESIQGAIDKKLIEPGDLVVLTAGTPVGIPGTTNLLKVHTAGEIIGSGTGIGHKVAKGCLRLATNAKEAVDVVKEGDILVARETNIDYMPVLEKVAAIITEKGGITSHAAIVGLDLGIPVIVGVEKALQTLPAGEIVTIDGSRGLIYRGKAQVL